MDVLLMSKETVAQKTDTTSFLSSAQGVLQRKCVCGNQTIGGGECEECGKKKGDLQRKLTIGENNDPLEREADRVADQVMAAPVRSAVRDTPLRIQRYAGQANESVDTAPDSVNRTLASSGRPMEPVLRQDMEQRFGHDFYQVRVHSGVVAEQSAREVNAKAYTAGNNIVFAASQLVPQTHEGRRLIAHELTHVVQQCGNTSTIIQRQEHPVAPVSDTANSFRRTLGPLISPRLAGFLGSRIIDNFVFGQSELSDAQQIQLQEYARTIVRLLLDHPAGIIYIIGHADAQGEDVDNVVLGQERADTVKIFLVGQGISADIIFTSSEGERQLTVRTTERNPRNRRVEINFRPSLPFNLGLGFDLTTTQPFESVAPRESHPSEISPDVLLPPQRGPIRLTRPNNVFNFPTPTRIPRFGFLREMSSWLTGSLGRQSIARLGGRMASELGMNRGDITRSLNDAMISGGEEGLKKLLEMIIEAVAGSPARQPNNTGPSLPERDIPGTRIFNSPRIPIPGS